MKFTEEQLIWQKKAREFAENELRPRLDEIIDSDDFFPRDLYRRMGELGFLGMMCQKKYKGSMAGMTDVCLVTEELSKVCPSAGLILMSVAPSLMLFQKSTRFREKYLSSCIKGEITIAGGIIAPASRVNITQRQALGVKQSNQYILNGSQSFVLANQDSDLNYVSGYDQDGHMRIWVLENSEGLYRNANEINFGMKASGVGTVDYRNVIVPDEMTFDVEAEHFSFYDMIWIQCSTIALGAAEGALNQAIDYAKTRTHNFKPVIHIQFQAERIAKMAAELMAARSLIYDATTTLDGGSDDVEQLQEGYRLCKAAKSLIPDLAFDISKESMKLHGGLGYSDVRIYHYLADAAATMIMGQTTESVQEALALSLGFDSNFE